MTTLTLTNNGGNSGGFLKFVIIVSLLVLMAAIGLSFSHATITHSDSDILSIRKCFPKSGATMIFVEPNNRVARVCKVNGVFGVQILEKVNGKWEEITSFFRNSAKSIKDIETYFRGSKSIKVYDNAWSQKVIESIDPAIKSLIH